MHTVWKGAISFGLVHVPVKLFTATESQDIAMRMLHRTYHSPIKYKRTCPECTDEVPWEDIVKGYEYEPGKFVIFEKEELQQLGDESSKEIKIVDFVDLSDIDPIYYQKTYYMAPGDTGANAYNLLKTALLETGKIGIANVTLRSKGSLAAIRVIDGCLSMVTMFYPAEIRSVAQVPNLPGETRIDERELTMAKMLIEQLSTRFEPGKFEDEYRKRLMEAISAKISGKQVVAAPEAPKTNVVNLMEALQASLEQARVTAQKDAQAGVRSLNDQAAGVTGGVQTGRGPTETVPTGTSPTIPGSPVSNTAVPSSALPGSPVPGPAAPGSAVPIPPGTAPARPAAGRGRRRSGAPAD